MRDLFTCNSLVPSLICNDHVTKKRRAINNFTPAQINWNQEWEFRFCIFSARPLPVPLNKGNAGTVDEISPIMIDFINYRLVDTC